MNNFHDKVQTILEYKKPTRQKITKYPGEKLSTTCPDCGYNAYGYHLGIHKSCTRCGLHNFMENRIDYIKRKAKHEHFTETNLIQVALISEVYDYVLDRNNEWRKYQ